MKQKNEAIYDAGYDEGYEEGYERARAEVDRYANDAYEEGLRAGRERAARRRDESRLSAYELGLRDGEQYIDESAYRRGLEAGARNKTAFTIGVLASIFGLWGLAHILNGKIGSGLLWMIFGMPLALGLVMGIAATGIGAIVALPLWVYFGYAHAKSGASYLQRS